MASILGLKNAFDLAKKCENLRRPKTRHLPKLHRNDILRVNCEMFVPPEIPKKRRCKSPISKKEEAGMFDLNICKVKNARCISFFKRRATCDIQVHIKGRHKTQILEKLQFFGVFRTKT